MNTRKTRADSVLGTLPEERQAEIAEFARAHSLDETCAWLKEDGVKLGRTALSLWLSSYCLRAQFKLADHDTIQFIELLRTRRPDLPESELQQWGAEFFQMQALKAGDSETFLAFASARTKAKQEAAKLELQQKQYGLDREKFEMQFADALRKALTDERLRGLLEKKAGNAEIIAHLRQTYFSDIDALQQSGSVQLPK